MNKKSKPRASGRLTYERAIEAMRRPSTRLVRMHGGSAGGFYVVPSGPVENAVAAKIMEHPFVRGSADGLFPGHDQTWRMV